MPSDFIFRFSIYLTLILSSVCLGFSEWDYLPEVTAFTAVVILAMIVAFAMDTRGRHLSLGQANKAGALIFAMAVGWLGFHYGQPDSLMHTLPWPAGGLPFLAPLLMLLIPAKLFRPKRVGDWWALYGISLASVGLGMSLAEEPFFMGLVLIYAAVGIWSLTLFYFRRSAGFEEKIEGEVSHDEPSQIGRSLRWIAAAGVVVVPLFFLTPRSNGVQWELFQSKIETGLSNDGSPDLGRTGVVKPSHEIAFEVLATLPDGQPKLDLAPDHRWRSSAFVEYQSPRGRWGRAVGRQIISSSDADRWRASDQLLLPDFGPRSFRLEFHIVGRTGGPIFSDPIAFEPAAHSPIAVPVRGGFGYAVQSWDTSFMILQREVRSASRYIQETRDRDPDGQEPMSPFALSDANDPQLLQPFVVTPPPAIAEYSRELLERLFVQRRLPIAIRTRMKQNAGLVPSDYAAVTEAFNEYLNVSGGFTYTLDLRRLDKNIDPIEDFLLHTRSGHCERFATALVLLLRGVGIPSQFVIGYRGSESTGEGRYIVRQEDAHAWAEVLLPKPGSRRLWYWKAFDPTPGIAAAEGDAEASIIESSTKQGKRLFAEYVINFNPDTQRRLTEGMGGFFRENWHYLAGGIVAAFALFWLLRSLRNRMRESSRRSDAVDPVPWFTRLVKVLHEAGLPQVNGETPREFAMRASDWLRSNPALSAFADLPMEVSKALYFQRYAERKHERGEIEALSATIESIPR